MFFGAKGNAISTYEYVRLADADICCFIVSSRADNPLFIGGKPVKTFDEISDSDKRDGLVIISQAYKDHTHMEAILSDAGFLTTIPGIMQFISNPIPDLKEYCLNVWNRMDTVREFLSASSMQGNPETKICIYAATSSSNLHQSSEYWRSDYIKYIHAGAALAGKKICALTDDSGDNISELNPYFCELTAGYWIAKNGNINDYVGLYHYSRGMDITDTELMSLTDSDIDVVLPLPYVFRYQINLLHKKDADDMLDAIRTVDATYANSTKTILSGNILSAANIIFAKRSVYCQYYEWLFKVIAEMQESKKRKSESVGLREWGYIAEHLTNVYFCHHQKQYHILYAEMKQIHF